jgi:hypothetical protein
MEQGTSWFEQIQSAECEEKVTFNMFCECVHGNVMINIRKIQ